MRTWQKTIRLSAKRRGFHLVTEEVVSQIDAGLAGFEAGVATLFLQHSSASLSINENCDPSVRHDMESFFNDTVDDKPYYTHTYEGPDDMPAHLKSVMLGVTLTLPVTQGRLNLGTWQGIYLNEHRDHAASRSIVVTILGS